MTNFINKLSLVVFDSIYSFNILFPIEKEFARSLIQNYRLQMFRLYSLLSKIVLVKSYIFLFDDLLSLFSSKFCCRFFSTVSPFLDWSKGIMTSLNRSKDPYP